MRFGDGTKLSINASGNLLQPWYYSVAFTRWGKLKQQKLFFMLKNK